MSWYELAALTAWLRELAVGWFCAVYEDGSAGCVTGLILSVPW